MGEEVVGIFGIRLVAGLGLGWGGFDGMGCVGIVLGVAGADAGAMMGDG